MSASGLNTYLNCPLQFYLQYVEQVQKDDEISETIDSSVFGSIYHGVMRDIYDRLIAGNVETLVTADMLNAVLKDRKFIDSLIAKWFSIVFFKTPPQEATRPKPLRGQYLIIAHIIEEYIKQTLVIDKGFAPFTYIASELRIDTDTYFPLDDGRKVAFKAFIDRVDAQDDTIRIVDYKTGKERCFSRFVHWAFPTSASSSPLFCSIAHLIPQLFAKMIRFLPFRSLTRLDSEVRLSVLGSSPSLRIQRTH